MVPLIGCASLESVVLEYARPLERKPQRETNSKLDVSQPPLSLLRLSHTIAISCRVGLSISCPLMVNTWPLHPAYTAPYAGDMSAFEVLSFQNGNLILRCLFCRSVMVKNWLKVGSITGNPILYPDDSPEEANIPAFVGQFGQNAFYTEEGPIPDQVEIEDRVLFNQKQAEEGLFGPAGKGFDVPGFEGGSPLEAAPMERDTKGPGTSSYKPDKVLGANGRVSLKPRSSDEAVSGSHEVSEETPGSKGSPAISRSPLSKSSKSWKTPEQRLVGEATGMVRSVSDRASNVDNHDGAPPGLLRTTSEVVGLIVPKQAQDQNAAQLEMDHLMGRSRHSDGLRPSLRAERGSPLASIPWGVATSELGTDRSKTPEPPSVLSREGSPPRGALVSPVKGLGLEPKRATPSGLTWSPSEVGTPFQTPRELPGPMDQVSPKPAMARQTSGKSEPRQEEDSDVIDEEHYPPAQWHKYLKSRSAQVLPHL